MDNFQLCKSGRLNPKGTAQNLLGQFYFGGAIVSIASNFGGSRRHDTLAARAGCVSENTATLTRLCGNNCNFIMEKQNFLLFWTHLKQKGWLKTTGTAMFFQKSVVKLQFYYEGAKFIFALNTSYTDILVAFSWPNPKGMAPPPGPPGGALIFVGQ